MKGGQLLNIRPVRSMYQHFLGIYIQGSRTSHPFKVIEPETISSSQVYSTEGANFQARGVLNFATGDRHSISESIGSERTASSCDMTTRGPTSGGVLGLVTGGSVSSVGGNSEINPSPQMNLRIENLVIEQQVNNGNR